MKAMVLAAGLGSRLRPMTETIPKALIPVAGRPMIEYPLLLLRRYGIKEVVVNLHHLGNPIESYLGNGSKIGLKIHFSREEKLMNTGGAILKARAFLEKEPFIVVNADVLIDLPLDRLLSYHRENKAAASLVLRADENVEQYGAIEIDRHGSIRRFLRHQAPQLSSGP